MQAEFWQAKWRNNEIGFHEGRPNPYLQRFWGMLALPERPRVLLPLCGKSQDLLWLAGQGCSVLGVELAAQAVEAFFAENGLTPEVDEQGPYRRYRCGSIELLCGDFFALGELSLGAVDAVYDRAALIALSAPQRAAYARLLSEVLPQRLEMLLVTMEYPQAQMSGPPFSVSGQEVTALYADSFRLQALLRQDVLADNAPLRERGLSELHECVWRLSR